MTQKFDRLKKEVEELSPESIFININVIVINMPNFTHISGGTFGALNVNGMQIVGSIDMKIGELQNNPDTLEFANALKELTETIASSAADVLNEQQRIIALQQLDALGQQASVPASQRNTGIIHALVNTLANVCAGAGGLAVAWQTWGPAITKFFGV